MIEDSILKNDIRLTRRSFDAQVSDREPADITTTASGDLATVFGRANLAQAILNRLLTRKGELAKLGHPDYGSRLHTLVGELNNARTQGIAALYIRECLTQEARVEKITGIKFALPSRGVDRSTLEITVSVKPIGTAEDLALTFSLNIGG